jgi:hypothetical protein
MFRKKNSHVTKSVHNKKRKGDREQGPILKIPKKNYKYSGALLIRRPLFWMLHFPDDFSGNKLYEDLSNVNQLSEHFIYSDDFSGS